MARLEQHRPHRHVARLTMHALVRALVLCDEPAWQNLSNRGHSALMYSRGGRKGRQPQAPNPMRE